VGVLSCTGRRAIRDVKDEKEEYGELAKGGRYKKESARTKYEALPSAETRKSEKDEGRDLSKAPKTE